MRDRYRIIFSKRSASNLESIYKYIAKDSAQYAQEFVERVFRAIEGLEIFPHRTVVEDQGRRVKHPVRSLPVESCVVIFRVIDQQRVVRILQIRHGGAAPPQAVSLTGAINMARIIDYDDVLKRLTAQGLICNYHNSGSFGFGRDVAAKYVGWVGPEDPTIREAMLPHVQRVAEPYDSNLARLMVRAQAELLHDVAWAMPISHWAYELEFGSDTWMPDLLTRIGIDPAELRVRNNGTAIEFGVGQPEFEVFLLGLLQGLSDSSDFMIAFPDRPALCMVHHHQQLWWMTKEEALAGQLRPLVE